jgi:hypothetical protein
MLTNHNMYFVFAFLFENSKGILKDTLKPYTTPSRFSPILTIESRGLEFIGWRPTSQELWAAENPDSGTTFDDIEFEGDDRDWAGYDEEASVPVGVTELEGKFERTK